jgi:hypothetical protein
VSERLITPKSTVWLRQAVYQADVSSRVYPSVTDAGEAHAVLDFAKVALWSGEGITPGAKRQWD